MLLLLQYLVVLSKRNTRQQSLDVTALQNKQQPKQIDQEVEEGLQGPGWLWVTVFSCFPLQLYLAVLSLLGEICLFLVSCGKTNTSEGFLFPWASKFVPEQFQDLFVQTSGKTDVKISLQICSHGSSNNENDCEGTRSLGLSLGSRWAGGTAQDGSGYAWGPRIRIYSQAILKSFSVIGLHLHVHISTARVLFKRQNT